MRRDPTTPETDEQAATIDAGTFDEVFEADGGDDDELDAILAEFGL